MLCNSMLCYIHYSNILIINVFLCETIFEKHGCKSLFQSYAEKSDFLFLPVKEMRVWPEGQGVVIETWDPK